MSSKDDREVVATCLNRGATDYLVKPLRHNELRHIWTRVWWSQRNKVRGHRHAMLLSAARRAGSRARGPAPGTEDDFTAHCPGQR
jgi:DNA-binding response OmpR family regulator